MLVSKMGYECRFLPPISFHKNIQRLLITGFILLPLSLHSQNQILQIDLKGESQFIEFENLLQLQRTKRVILWSHIEKGFLFASLDSIEYRSDTIIYKLRHGKAMELSRETQSALKERDKPLSKYWNTGYPFAQLYYDSIYYSDNEELQVKFSIKKGTFIAFDSLRVLGDANYSSSYLQNATGIRLLNEYSERKYQEVSARLSKMKAARLRYPPDLGFAGGKATVILNLEKLDTDKFEGILGVLPSQESNRTNVTGYINLSLNNLFRSGKEFHFKWNRFAQNAQSLDLKFAHPFILQSPVEIRTDFSLLRQDSLFVKRNFSLIFSLPISKSIDFSMTLSSRASDILGSETNSEFGLDYRLTDYKPGISFGRKFFQDHLEDGFNGQLAFGFGDKRISRNQLFPVSIYDSIQLRSSNYQLDVSLISQKILGEKISVFTKFDLGLLEGSNILINEYYRLGGLRSLRGFNESNFLARRFVKLQSEYRFFFESSSFLFGLIDIASLSTAEDNFVTSSVGGGLALDTENGQFELIFALGSINNIEFNFHSTKVHFGYSITF